MNNNKITGKNVLITAGAQGIGEAITKHFIDSGANVAIHYFSSADTANKLVDYALLFQQELGESEELTEVLKGSEDLHMSKAQ